MKLKKIGYLSSGYAVAIFYSIMMVIQSILIKFQFSITDISQLDQVYAILYGFGWWILPIFFIIGLIAGFLGGIILALIYNHIVVRLTGGLSFELEK